MPEPVTLPQGKPEGKTGYADLPPAGDAKKAIPWFPDNERWDFFSHPDRFFSRLLSGEYSLIVPSMFLLVAILPSILFWRIMAGYYDCFVPYLHLSNSGGEIALVLTIGTIIILGILFFPYITDLPNSLHYCYPCSARWKEVRPRVTAALGYAIVPLILWQFIGILALVVILPGLSIVPPPTTAFDAYHKAEADFHSVSPFIQTANGMIVDTDNWEKRGSYRMVMRQLQGPAEAEASEATRDLASQLIRDPMMRALIVGMLVLWIIASLWTGILLTFGMRHALALSLEVSAALSVVFLIYLGGLLAFIPRFLFGSILWPA